MGPNEFVYKALSKSGIPGTEYAWPIGKAPDLPWFVYRRERGGEKFADDANYERMSHYRAELYMKEEDEGVRAAFEEAVSSVGPFSANEGWVPSENCMMVAYTFTYHFQKEEN